MRKYSSGRVVFGGDTRLAGSSTDVTGYSRTLAGTTLAVLLAIVFASIGGCAPADQVHRMEGATMGTGWHVVAVGDIEDRELLAQQIQERLDLVNDQMSTYQTDSELSRFNTEAKTGEWFPVSADTATVVAASLLIHRQSSGAFDVTVAPLVARWGFGPGHVSDVPTDEELAQLLSAVDGDALRQRSDPPALLRQQLITVDLSAIAKGFAVDRVAHLLNAQDVDHWLVEVGGEVRMHGHNPQGAPWRIGITMPDQLRAQAAHRLALSNGAVATSGDYRNFRMIDGRRYSHTIDPTTGMPVDHQTASVTVVAQTAMMADGWATAFSVLGSAKGMPLARDLGLAVAFLDRSSDAQGSFTLHTSDAMRPFLME